MQILIAKKKLYELLRTNKLISYNRTGTANVLNNNKNLFINGINTQKFRIVHFLNLLRS